MLRLSFRLSFPPPPHRPSSSTTQIRRHWSGLDSWRQSPINNNRHWGHNGPSLAPLSPSPPLSITTSPPSSLSEWGALVLSTADPSAKSQISHIGFTAHHSHNLPIGIATAPDYPARPPRPPMVGMKEMPKHKESGLPLNVYMLHNLAHVELNAIDLAWDTVVRFSAFREVLGDVFFEDFARVADDESRHFLWCSQRLAELGFRYTLMILVPYVNDAHEIHRYYVFHTFRYAFSYKH